MNRLTEYLLLIIGAALGYIGSYFGQSGMLRSFASLGDYIESAREILIPRSGSESGAFGEITRGVFFTAWTGIFLGVVIIGAIIVFYLGHTKKRPV